jgi:hypothetical protein
MSEDTVVQRYDAASLCLDVLNRRTAYFFNGRQVIEEMPTLKIQKLSRIVTWRSDDPLKESHIPGRNPRVLLHGEFYYVSGLPEGKEGVGSDNPQIILLKMDQLVLSVRTLQ